MIEAEMSEDTIQKKLVLYIKEHYPNVLFTCSVAGLLPILTKRTFSSQKYSPFLSKIKNMGYRNGTPDLIIFEPKEIDGLHYNGMLIELKKIKGKISDYQNEFMKLANERNYYCVVCFGLKQAIDTIDFYLANHK